MKPITDEEIEKRKEAGKYEWRLLERGESSYRDKIFKCIKCETTFEWDSCPNCGSSDCGRYSSEAYYGKIICGKCLNAYTNWLCPKCGAENRFTVGKISVLKEKKKSYCFIATAVYGSYSAPHVMLLRNFRDQILLQSHVGKALIRFYYLVSPPIANFISKKETRKKWVRLGLIEPCIKYIKKHTVK